MYVFAFINAKEKIWISHYSQQKKNTFQVLNILIKVPNLHLKNYSK